MTCHVVCAGPGAELDASVHEGDFVAAVDGGYAACVAAGIAVDLLIGDFDSLEGGRPADYEGEVVELPWEKDVTDLEAALALCMERGERSFVVHRALGGDVGHTLAAIRAMARLKGKGVEAVLLGGGQRAFVVTPEDGAVAIADEPGTRVSVFAAGEVPARVTERGLHWELDDVELATSDSIGVSNQVEAQPATVSVSSGMALVIVG